MKERCDVERYSGHRNLGRTILQQRRYGNDRVRKLRGMLGLLPEYGGLDHSGSAGYALFDDRVK